MIKTFDEFEALHPEMSYSDAHEAYVGTYFKDNAEIGDGATLCLWIASQAYTVIKRTPNTLTLQRCKATLKPEWKPEWYIGGFAAHCANQSEQDYTYEDNENGRIIVAHWSKKYNRFRHQGCTIIPNRHEFYDYNS